MGGITFEVEFSWKGLRSSDDDYFDDGFDTLAVGHSGASWKRVHTCVFSNLLFAFISKEVCAILIRMFLIQICIQV